MAEKKPIVKAVQEKLSREDLMDITSDFIRDLRQKGISGRFRDPNNERMRDAKTRLLLQCIQAYTILLRDQELVQLEQRISELELQRSRQ